MKLTSYKQNFQFSLTMQCMSATLNAISEARVQIPMELMTIDAIWQVHAGLEQIFLPHMMRQGITFAAALK